MACHNQEASSNSTFVQGVSRRPVRWLRVQTRALDHPCLELGCENSATYQRWQSISTNNRRRYFTALIRNRVFLASSRVVLKSAGSVGVCAVSHFILVYTTVLTSWWVSEDMSLPTARQPEYNRPTWRCWQRRKDILSASNHWTHSAMTIICDWLT